MIFTGTVANSPSAASFRIARNRQPPETMPTRPELAQPGQIVDKAMGADAVRKPVDMAVLHLAARVDFRKKQPVERNLFDIRQGDAVVLGHWDVLSLSGRFQASMRPAARAASA
ncbi:MAG: hypothetical protein JKP98_26275 [Rhodobacteraceae bacterium]|nr:hypothetical protein [Paracoccaceae bacterium]